MKIEIQNSIVRLRFLCRVTDTKIAWIKPGLYAYVLLEIWHFPLNM